jgi:two-component system, LytTR family, sensor kinase
VTLMNTTQAGARRTPWRWVAAIWSATGLFDASQNVLIMHTEGKHHSWLPLFATELALWLPWAAASPLIIHLARRYPIARGMSVRSAAVHLSAFAVISALAETWSALLQITFNPWNNRKWPTFVDTWSTSLLYQALTFLVVYALIVTVTLMLDSRERVSHQIAETARLHEELSQAQLAALRRQMEPHFVYNALNSVAGLVRDEQNDAAVSMLVGLSEFLRRSSEDSHRAQVTLEEEVEYLRRYVEIQKVRFGERFQVSIDIPAELRHAQVPNLLLQPLVENAIKHGIARRVAGGSVRIAARRHDASLGLSVYNDGPSLPADWETTQTGVGLRNLRTRLHILHGDDSDLQLRSAAPDGVEVLVKLPFRES